MVTLAEVYSVPKKLKKINKIIIDLKTCKTTGNYWKNIIIKVTWKTIFAL